MMKRGANGLKPHVRADLQLCCPVSQWSTHLFYWSATCRRAVAGLLCALAVASCSSPAPVEDRSLSDPVDRAAVERLQPSIHKVIKGETLYSIARRYSVTPLQLQRLNSLADANRLEIGQLLRIPVSFGSRPLIWPLQRYQVTSEFGSRRGRHKGIDLGAPKKTPVRASAAGVVKFTGKKNGYGKVVILSHGAGLETLYAHNHKNKVRTGQRVAQGDVIATVGHSGRATGSHLHFEAIVQGRQRNPRQYLMP